MKQITSDATVENLPKILSFVENELQIHDCPMKGCMQILIAVEEIYANIAHYAYTPKIGKATVVCTISEEPLQATIEFHDTGKPFDPLAKKDTDITLCADDREIGGLGILMVKKSMDAVTYRYENKRNILTIKKTLHCR